METNYWSRKMASETVASETVDTFSEGYTIEESVYRDGYTLYRILRGGDFVASFPSYIEALEYARDFLNVNVLGR